MKGILAECDRMIEPNTLYIGKGVTIKGDISVSRLVIVEGRVEGRIFAHAVWVGPSGSLKGMLYAAEAELHGLVSDKIVVTERLRIHPTGRVVGDVNYRELILERGGTISGTCAPNSADCGKGPAPVCGEVGRLEGSAPEGSPAAVVALFQK